MWFLGYLLNYNVYIFFYIGFFILDLSFVYLVLLYSKVSIFYIIMMINLVNKIVLDIFSLIRIVLIGFEGYFL